mgnify:CR=1 FL=1
MFLSFSNRIFYHILAKKKSDFSKKIRHIIIYKNNVSYNFKHNLVISDVYSHSFPRLSFVHIYIAFCSVKELTIFLFITAKSTFDFAQWDEVDFWKQFCSCYIFNNNYFVKNYSNRIRMEIVKYTYRLLLHCS